jgi:hypothetical protein
VSVADVSAQTRKRYGDKSAYFIPPTFSYKQKVGISPHLCQVVALSEITDCPFTELMAAFGFDLGLIFALQLRIHRERTTLVTPDMASDSPALSHNSKRLKSNKRYLFAKIGTRDAVVYPRVRPGSIVRADRRVLCESVTGSSDEETLWLVEYPGGLVCCHVRRIDRENVLLLPNRSPLSAWPLRLSQEVRILGQVDLELWTGGVTRSEPKDSSTGYKLPLPASTKKVAFSRMLHSSRLRAGLTLRKAHELTIKVSGMLGDRNYGIALGLLSDYEATDRLPRHIAKILSLCVVYGIDFWDLIESGGVQIEERKQAMAAAA